MSPVISGEFLYRFSGSHEAERATTDDEVDPGEPTNERTNEARVSESDRTRAI